MSFPQITLNRKKELSVKRRHPWVFSGAINHIDQEIFDGDTVEVCDASGKYLGTGHFNEGSIAVHLFTFEQQEITADFWKQKLRKAFEARTVLGLTNNDSTNIYRLVFGEGDGLPGLILDHYNGVIVYQAFTIGMYNLSEVFIEGLQEIYGDKLKAVYDKSSESLPAHYADQVNNACLWGDQELTKALCLENGHKFEIDWVSGQKTGFFIDQRENRNLLAAFCKDKTVLNTFCYSGGFSIYALKAGAKFVSSVDSSEKAIELVERNIALNDLDATAHESHVSDTLQHLKETANTYDIIVLDPPAYAKRRAARHNAIQGYKRLNIEAMKRIKKGGVLFTFSCSQVIDKGLFDNTITAAAIEAGREISILGHMFQPGDHKTSIFHGEGNYLKGLILEVQ